MELQVIKSSKYLIIVIGLLSVIIFSSQKVDCRPDYRKLILGKWHGKQDSLDITLQFNKDDGYIGYSTTNKKYSFQYSFKNDSIIKVWGSKEKPQLHIIIRLDKEYLHLRPYPIKIREAIDLIDQIDFEKQK